jgi:hypothetical protein
MFLVQRRHGAERPGMRYLPDIPAFSSPFKALQPAGGIDEAGAINDCPAQLDLELS